MSKIYYIDLTRDELNKYDIDKVWLWKKEEIYDGVDIKVTLKDGCKILDNDNRDDSIHVESKYVEYEGEEDVKKEDLPMTKVKITKEWAEVIELMKKNGDKFENAFIDFMEQELGYLDYDSITAEEFSIAYLVDYEVKETPEERLLGLYNINDNCTSEWSDGYCNGVDNVLNTLGIKIKGINE